MACLHVAKLHFSGGDFREALRVLDMGLIMGGSLLREDLDSAVEKISVEARKVVRVSEKERLEVFSNSDHQLVRGEIDKAEVRFVLFSFALNPFVHSSSNHELRWQR